MLPASTPASTAFERPRSRPDPEDADQHVILYGMTWNDYETLLAMRGDRAGVRLFYLNGAIELMSPTRSHEGIKTTLARLLEAYCEERNVELSGYGSWTLRSAPEARGAEPDECYMVGSTDKQVPDLALEVIWSHGGLDKLEIYRGLGVAEVWIWDRDAGLRVFALRDGGYAQATGSKLFPDLDLAWFASFVDQPTQTQAVRALRAAMR
jgi:Uma2 family endonuclease